MEPEECVCEREIGRKGQPDHVCRARRVDGERGEKVEAAAAEARRVHDRVAGRRQLRHERVVARATSSWHRVDFGKVRRVRDPGDVGGARCVDFDGEADVWQRAAEVRRVDEAGAGGIEFRDESIIRSEAVRVPEQWVHRREVDRRCASGDVRVSGPVHGDSAGDVVAAASDVRRIGDLRIDDERHPLVVAAHVEAYAPCSVHPIPARDRRATGRRLLVDRRPQLTHLVCADVHDEIARGLVDEDVVRSVHRDADGRHVRAWGDHKVVLEGASAAVVHHVDPVVGTNAPNPGVRRHVRMPSTRVVAEEVVRLSIEQLLALHARRRRRPLETHPQRPSPAAACEGQDRLVLGHERRSASEARDEPHARVGLTLVGFEAHRSTAERVVSRARRRRRRHLLRARSLRREPRRACRNGGEARKGDEDGGEASNTVCVHGSSPRVCPPFGGVAASR